MGFIVKTFIKFLSKFQDEINLIQDADANFR